jgi:hypothetical protein
VDEPLALVASRSGAQLTLTGDAPLAGSYLALEVALARVGVSTARDAACAFHVANLAVVSSEVRILGFGGPGMTQYSTPATFVGVVSGSVRVEEHGLFTSTTNITYSGFSDFPGVVIDGTQNTVADASGNGHMWGDVQLALAPAAPAPAVTGTIGYGVQAGGGNSIVISGGVAGGGHYEVTLGGGGAALVDPVAPPAPSLGDCLSLP